MKILILLCFFCYSCNFGQTEKANYDRISSWSANFGTSLFFNSAILNFETRNLIKNEKLNQLHLNVGVGYFNFFVLGKTQGVSIPIYASYLIGKGNNLFEIDLGFNLFVNKQGYPQKTTLTKPLPKAMLGYRYQNSIYPFWFKTGIGFPEVFNVGFGYRL